MTATNLMPWSELKRLIEHALDVSHDALHVVLGVVLLLAAAVAFRRSICSWSPWVAVLTVTLCNEALDLWVEQWPNAAMQYGEGIKDLILTMLLPTVLMASVRTRPDLFRRDLQSRSANVPKAKTADSRAQ